MFCQLRAGADPATLTDATLIGIVLDERDGISQWFVARRSIADAKPHAKYRVFVDVIGGSGKVAK